MNVSLENLPYEYLFELFLKTGYPKFLNFCESHPNLNVLCNDKHLWTLLLQKDYYDVIKNKTFSDPKRTYITIYKVFHNNNDNITKKIGNLAVEAAIDNNLELIKVLDNIYPNKMIYHNLKLRMIHNAVKVGSFAVVIYLLQNERLDINYKYLIDYYYINKNKVGAKEFFNIMLRDERFNKIDILYEAIRHDDVETTKSLINQSNVNFAFITAISNNNIRITIYLLDNYDILPRVIEEGIVILNKYGFKNEILLMLLKTNKYDPNNLFILLSKDMVLDTIKYLIKNNKINSKALNNAAVNSLKNCNLKLLDLLLEQKSFDPLFSRSIILTLTNNNCLTNVIDKLVTYDNFNKILIDITKHSINNNVLKLLLNSKFLEHKHLLQDVLMNLIQNINEQNLNQDNIILVLDKIDKIDDIVLFKCLKIAIEKKFSNSIR